MKKLIDALAHGVQFIRNNPQIIGTLFLLILIPLAFIYTSEQFLTVQREDHDRLERSRVGLLQDAIATFIPDVIVESGTLSERITSIKSLNEQMQLLQVITPIRKGAYYVVASPNSADIGKPIEADAELATIMGAALANSDLSYAYERYVDGERIWRAVRAVQIDDRESYYILTDISMSEADRQTQKNIREAYMILFIVVCAIAYLLLRHARIIDYTTLYMRLKDIDQMKDDFISMAAHELRSPLTVIRGYVEMLGEGEGLTVAGKQHLKKIDTAAVELNSLIGDILDVSRLQEGRMSYIFTMIDPSEIVTSVVDGFMQPAHAKLLALRLSITKSAKINADQDRLRQVLVNLIGNAIKYTPKGEVTVSIDVVGKKLQIKVSDTGMGISALDQKYLFKKFFRVKNQETAKIQGTGLGLWITQKIVVDMHGEIALESISGKGSVFIVSFPVVA